jgi:hypothetical protein
MAYIAGIHTQNTKLTVVSSTIQQHVRLVVRCRKTGNCKLLLLLLMFFYYCHYCHQQSVENVRTLGNKI